MTFSSQIEKEAGPQAGLFAGVQLEPLRVEDPGESSKAGSAALGGFLFSGPLFFRFSGEGFFLFSGVLLRLFSGHCLFSYLFI